MVLLWDKWRVFNGNKATFFPSPQATVTASAIRRRTLGQRRSRRPARAVERARGAAQVPGGGRSARWRVSVSRAPDAALTFVTTDGGSLTLRELLKLSGDGRRQAPFVLLDSARTACTRPRPADRRNACRRTNDHERLVPGPA